MYWWKRKITLGAAVLFKGELAPRADEFSFLEQAGISVEPLQGRNGAAWCLRLSHSEWGCAHLEAGAKDGLPPRELFQNQPMPRADKEEASRAGSWVRLAMEGSHEHVLRDRKAMLRFIGAVMGQDGVGAFDLVSGKVWTRAALDDELSHDADLDVEGVFSVHAVLEDSGRVGWVHTHGLSELGAFDVDLFEPSPDTLLGMQELFRALAFHVLEGSLKPSTARFCLMHPRGDIRLVGMESFLEQTDAARRERLLGLVDGDHRKSRSVLCQPEGSFLRRLFGRKSLEPVRFLTSALPENPVFPFSTPASDLMAERAKKTYPLLRRLREEFAPYPFPCLVKLGIRTADGSETDKEHLWFEVHALGDDSIEGTLTNQPYWVSGMKAGDRGHHSIDLLSDWTMVTCAGMITPRSTDAARVLRENPEALAEILQEMKKNGVAGG